MTKYDPYKIHRKVRLVETSPTGFVKFKTKSFTKEWGEYHPKVNVLTGEVLCDCPDFIYNRIYSGTLCKHLSRAVANLRRREQENEKGIHRPGGGACKVSNHPDADISGKAASNSPDQEA